MKIKKYILSFLMILGLGSITQNNCFELKNPITLLNQEATEIIDSSFVHHNNYLIPTSFVTFLVFFMGGCQLSMRYSTFWPFVLPISLSPFILSDIINGKSIEDILSDADRMQLIAQIIMSSISVKVLMDILTRNIGGLAGAVMPAVGAPVAVVPIAPPARTSGC